MDLPITALIAIVSYRPPTATEMKRNHLTKNERVALSHLFSIAICFSPHEPTVILTLSSIFDVQSEDRKDRSTIFKFDTQIED